jgi:hypothetical protein
MMWYSRRMAGKFAAAVVILVSVLGSAPAAAQPRRPPQNDPDLAELAAYRLTTSTLQKIAVAMQTFAQALEADPKYNGYMAAEKELKALEAKTDPSPADEERMEALGRQLEQMSNEIDSGDARTLAEMEQKIATMPHMAGSLAKAGLTPREYAKFTLAMIQAGFLAEMKKAGQLREVPPGASLDNIQFVIDHEKEIAALTAQMQGK